MKKHTLTDNAPVDPFESPVLCPTDAAGSNSNGARFGCSRDSGTKWHAGIDLKAAVGTSLKAIYPGKVTSTRLLDPTDPNYQQGVGNFVIIKSKNFAIKYCHLDAIAVSINDIVDEGDLIGKTGASGNAYNAPFKHLHLEVSTDYFATKDNYVDPEPYLKTKYTPVNPNSPDHSNCPAILEDDEESE